MMAVGGWHLIEELGRGGNGVVWKAERAGVIAAVKLLHQVRVASDSYRRFREEITLLRKLGDHPGILPLLDAELPETPSRSTAAWLAMPIGVSVRTHLGANPSLRPVVNGIVSVARTLASLASRRISHRDINPENLYYYKGGWVVGDFGLAEFPGKQPITEAGGH
jgi:serine/threonine protein kinase